MDDQLTGYQRHLPCPPGALEKLQRLLGVKLPSDYLAFLEAGDGGEGFVGEDYLVLWRAGELHPFNQDYEVQANAPGLLGFGSNGGGEMFAFDLRVSSCPVLMVPFIGMSLEDAFVVAGGFTQFIRRMQAATGSLFDKAPEA